MKPLILYASKSGNTKKLADAIANQINAPTIKISADTTPAQADLESYDLIFLGTGLYAGTPNEDLVCYLKNLDLKTAKPFALFITWGGAPRSDKMALAKLRVLLKAKGQRVLEEHFAAFGGWRGILMKRGHPKPEEIQAAATWAKGIVEKTRKTGNC
jgi:flavodoxin